MTAGAVKRGKSDVRALKLLIIPGAAVTFAAPAQAQPGPSAEAAALGNCFVAKSTGEDRISLVRWFTGALLGSPKTADLASVDAAKAEQSQREAAAVFTRLMTKDCLAQSRAVAKSSDAQTGFRQAGEALGRIAVTELLTDPATGAKISEFTRYLSKDDFKVLEDK